MENTLEITALEKAMSKISLIIQTADIADTKKIVQLSDAMTTIAVTLHSMRNDYKEESEEIE